MQSPDNPPYRFRMIEWQNDTDRLVGAAKRLVDSVAQIGIRALCGAAQSAIVNSHRIAFVKHTACRAIGYFYLVVVDDHDAEGHAIKKALKLASCS